MPRLVLSLIALCLVFVNPAFALDPKPSATFALDSAAGLEAVNAKAEAVTYRGRRAVHLGPHARPGKRRWRHACPHRRT
jgi:hypothetical protein